MGTPTTVGGRSFDPRHRVEVGQPRLASLCPQQTATSTPIGLGCSVPPGGGLPMPPAPSPVPLPPAHTVPLPPAHPVPLQPPHPVPHLGDGADTFAVVSHQGDGEDCCAAPDGLASSVLRSLAPGLSPFLLLHPACSVTSSDMDHLGPPPPLEGWLSPQATYTGEQLLPSP